MTESTLFFWIYWIIILVLVIMITREALYLYFNHPRRYGKNGVWPSSGQFVPTKEGSGGMDPSGGMRPLHVAPRETDVGWWNGSIDQSTHNIVRETYDEETIPSPVKNDVGWWGDEM